MALRICSGKILNSLSPRCQAVACISSHEIRRKFIDYFREENAHEFIPSSPVTLRDDPSLLFVNAGMNQFKPKFLETIDPFDKLASVRRAVNSQKCIRVGGKHNDLDDVGKDTSHHTFFEMLGSWSFGDYFKEQACGMALELLTKHFEINIDRLRFTYFRGDDKLKLEPDLTTQKIWRSFGIPENQILPFGTEDNFWEMGDVGPCGPCTEIHYVYGDGRRDMGHLVNKGHPDVVEIWNIVFMQYNRLSNGDLAHLPTNHVDTGMGLERISAVLQRKKSNYDTDLFIPIIKAIQEVCNCPIYNGLNSTVDQTYRIVSDHVRMLTIAIADRTYPGNTGAELIVRQVLRRAYLGAKQHLNAPNGLLKALSEIVIKSLSPHYTYLRERECDILETIQAEENRFTDTLIKGENIFYKTVNKMDNTNFPVETAILLFNHYGYPLDILLDSIKEKNLVLDIQEFNRYQEERERMKRDGREVAKSTDHHTVKITANVINRLNTNNIAFTNSDAKYNFVRNANGTYSFPSIQSTILAIVLDGRELKDAISSGQRCALLSDRTCFYHTEGGQVSDTGGIYRNQNKVFEVTDVTYAGGYVFHHGVVTEDNFGVEVGDKVELRIDDARREACMRAHTATHVLNHALREILSFGVSQQGSKVSEDELRFTFTGPTPSMSDLKRISDAVHNQIEEGHQVCTNILPIEDALKDTNVRRLTDGVYSNPARVVSIGSSVGNDHSVELCAGTHVQKTTDIGDFALTLCKSQGVRKTTVRCLTASLAEQSIQSLRDLQIKVHQKTEESSKILSEDGVSKGDCLNIKSKIGKLNYDVNCADISTICKSELKEKLRKHSQMLSSKIRLLQRQGAKPPATESTISQ